jgi:hypothetical protein
MLDYCDSNHTIHNLNNWKYETENQITEAKKKELTPLRAEGLRGNSFLVTM